ncbi:eukaryotic translation initiation factor 3 subunit F-2 [Drosophila tropicalis]|uniref:eukaryotic translation initiation factor 3 subunit F-2 n=1 Tax=Drosophila tropicalis TaxID=46794 RepID=UPI0035AB82E9
MQPEFKLRSKILLQPLVLLHIIDAYDRRPKDCNQVIGTLLGRNNPVSGHLEISNCFTLLHKDYPNSSRIDVDLQYANDMYELNQLTYPQEKIIGWYATGKTVSGSAVHLHEYYARECADGKPMHLLIDTSLRCQRMMMRLYTAVVMGVPNGTKGLMFSLLPLEMSSGNPESVALNLMKKNALQPSKQVGRILPEMVQVVDITRDLQTKLDLVLRYVNDTLARKRSPNNTVGRALHEALTSVPLVDAESFRMMFNSNVRDMLMSITLATMIKAQLKISESVIAMSNR